MKVRQLEHQRNPRRAVVFNGSGRQGLDLTADRHGVTVSGFYDTFVGLEPLHLTWDELAMLKSAAFRTFKDVTANREAFSLEP